MLPSCWAVHISHHSKTFPCVSYLKYTFSSHLRNVVTQTCFNVSSSRGLTTMLAFLFLNIIVLSLISLWVFCRIQGTFCCGDAWWWGWRTIFSPRSLWHIFVLHWIFWGYRRVMVVDCRPCCTFCVPCRVGRQVSIQYCLSCGSRVVLLLYHFWWVQVLFCYLFLQLFWTAYSLDSPHLDRLVSAVCWSQLRDDAL